jgi:radical SAM-linked protein
MQANYVQRIRLTFSKTAYTRFIGHLDLARALERAVNRARIPVAYSQGFNKRPRMQLADALPLGFTSECEMADLWLREHVEPGDAEHRLKSSLPDGLVLHAVREVEISETALQNQTVEATYVVVPGENIESGELQSRIDTLLSQSSIPRERRGKNYDLRPRVFSLALSDSEEEPPEITMILSLAPGEVGRPDEVLDSLGLDPLSAAVHRSRILLENDKTP